MKEHALAETCEFPDHGQPTAKRACCRPGVATPAVHAAQAEPANTLAFWADFRTWKTASQNTLNCLVGCMIGDIGAILYLQAYHPHTPMWLVMSLAMAAGLITSILFESILLRVKEKFAWRQAVVMAFSMSFLSMLAMEAAVNATDWFLTGGRVPMHDPFYWGALGISVAAGFIVPLPYNYYKFRRHGKACH